MHLRFRTVTFVSVCLLLCSQAWAQVQHHYVYIQSEKGQPFYVKHNGQVLSSTERGYIILPQLSSGTTPITVGFPKNESPEVKFDLRIAKNDQGFLLKKSGDAAYSLYDLQSFREIKSEEGTAVQTAAATETPAPAPVEADTTAPVPDTAKKEMMANLQKDLETTFADKAVVTGPNKPVNPVKPAANKGNSFSSALDKVVVSGDDRNEPEPEVAATPAQPVTAPAADEPEVKKSRGGRKHKGAREPLTEEEQALLTEVMAEENRTAASEAAAADAAKAATEEAPVKKQKKHKQREGDPDFIEFQDDKAQTVSAAGKDAAAATPAPAVVEVPVEATPVPVEDQPVRKKKKRSKIFDDTEHPANVITDDSSGYGVMAPRSDEAPVKSKKKKKHSDEVEMDAAGAPVGAAVAAEEPVAKKKSSETRLLNSDCTNIMDEATFRKVLRKFAAAKTDNSMIDVFMKQTRNYCLETAQVKTLVSLLTADDTRYRLLDAAYPKTYDTEKYGSLENILIDDYYRGRFRAMLHK
ncbi:DUF4476 domain-containing protein [Chitinophaga polysaccharea]|uniref:DUF4476 domain-containing protein n=1 Tax=Chitinophaga polysaccharea TaxID=1293035 RepID=UPI0014555BD0|nr:DUF4476 domain-containing protein [Chitinophaga polysaccharea]NLR62106.1 DUF4476 domain-containing protein [Chitinophaga polysaccharea]